MKRIYAELFSLFSRFYRDRMDLNPSLSAGALLAAIQMICLVDIALLLSWSGVLAYDFSNYRAAVAVVAAILALGNYTILRGGRAKQLVAQVGDSPLPRARGALIVVGCATVLTMLLYKGFLVWP